MFTYCISFKLVAPTYGTNFQLVGMALVTYGTSFELVTPSFGTNFQLVGMTLLIYGTGFKQVALCYGIHFQLIALTTTWIEIWYIPYLWYPFSTTVGPSSSVNQCG